MGCDVFISYKREVSEDGVPIRDQVLASALRDALEARGVQVFFSEKDLSDPDMAYPIYKALREAPILIVAATTRDNLESERTFSEWRRFRNAILTGEKPDGEIITYLEGMTAEELPFALSDTETFTPQERDELVDWVVEGLGMTDDAAETGDSPVDGETPGFPPESEAWNFSEEAPTFFDQEENQFAAFDEFSPDAPSANEPEEADTAQKKKLMLSVAAVLLAVSSLAVVAAVILSSGSGRKRNSDITTVSSTVERHTGYRGSDSLRSVTELVPTDKVKRGDHLRFGTWEQDGDTTNGTEYIEWRVIAVEDRKALLLAEYLLDHRCYDSGTVSQSVTWENCVLRQWLHQNFLHQAFNNTERSCIVPVITSEDAGDGDETEGWNDVQDQVFALSIDEVRQYLVSNDNAKGLATDASYNSEFDDKERYGNWWLRSLGSKQGNAAYVKYGGSVNSYGKLVFSESIAVRPALWVQLP